MASLLLDGLNRRRGAAEVTQILFPLSYRTLEAWPLPSRLVNGQAIIPARALFHLAYEKFAAAPVILGGRRSSARSDARLPANDERPPGQISAAIFGDALMSGALPSPIPVRVNGDAGP